MADHQFYVQVKIRFCQTKPFEGLAALGMWYGEVVADEIPRWKEENQKVRLGPTQELAALCRNQGYHLRRVRTDGKFLLVHDWRTDELLEDTLLPVALLGTNIELMHPEAVVNRLLSLGGVWCEFEIDGRHHRGCVLDTGEMYNAAWDEHGRPWHFECDRSRNPNGRIVRLLARGEDSPTTSSRETVRESSLLFQAFLDRFNQIGDRHRRWEAKHHIILPKWRCVRLVSCWTIERPVGAVAWRCEVQEESMGSGRQRACLLLQRLPGTDAKARNTPHLTLSTDNLYGSRSLQVRPHLSRSEFAWLEREVRRRRLPFQIHDRRIGVGDLLDRDLLDRLLLLTELVADARSTCGMRR